jgi:hypothetical protein
MGVQVTGFVSVMASECGYGVAKQALAEKASDGSRRLPGGHIDLTYWVAFSMQV